MGGPLDVSDFGVAKTVDAEELIECLDEIVDVVSITDNLTTYGLCDEWDRAHGGKGGPGGISGTIKGVPFALKGGMGYCIFKFGIEGAPPNVRWLEERDVRNEKYIDTDDGRIEIVKGRVKKIHDLDEIRGVLEKLKQLPKGSQVEVLIG